MKREPESNKHRIAEEATTSSSDTLAQRDRVLQRGVSQPEKELLANVDRQRKEELDQLRSQNDIYVQVVESARRLSSILEVEELIGATLHQVVKLFRVDRGFLLLAEPSGRLDVVQGYHRDSGPIEPKPEPQISRTLVEAAYKERRVRDVSNALGREEFRKQQSIQALELNTIVCVPLSGRLGPIGVLYLDSKSPEGVLAAEQKNILEAFAAHAAIAIENARLHKELLDAQAGLERENRDLRRALPGAQGLGEILGKSVGIEDLRRRIGQLQEVESPVLIRGASGTGKELVARAIHAGSRRSEKSYIIVNCPAIPKELMESELFGHRKGSFTGATHDKQGLFEAADGGTLFFDEIGDMPIDQQSRLLRVLESGEFRRIGETANRNADVRILSATNRNLEDLITKGGFREDLYFRLKVISLHVPPLKDRKEDILLLAEHFLRKTQESRGRPFMGFTTGAVQFLLEHKWPGNVRELLNTIEGACAFVPPNKPLDAHDLRVIVGGEPSQSPASGEPSGEGGLREYREDAEKRALLEALDEAGWVVSHAAPRLGISRQHLHNKMRHYGIHRPRVRRSET